MSQESGESQQEITDPKHAAEYLKKLNSKLFSLNQELTWEQNRNKDVESERAHLQEILNKQALELETSQVKL